MSAPYLLNSLERAQISTLPTSLLDDLIRECSRELCKRRGKDPVTRLKEWTEQDRRRKIWYSYERRGTGRMKGTITITDENGKKYTECWTHEDQREKANLRRPTKRRLSELGVALLSLGEEPQVPDYEFDFSDSEFELTG